MKVPEKRFTRSKTCVGYFFYSNQQGIYVMKIFLKVIVKIFFRYLGNIPFFCLYTEIIAAVGQLIISIMPTVPSLWAGSINSTKKMETTIVDFLFEK